MMIRNAVIAIARVSAKAYQSGKPMPATRSLPDRPARIRCAAARTAAIAVSELALTDDEVIFFFGEGQVIPDNSGPRRISVPRSELAALMQWGAAQTKRAGSGGLQGRHVSLARSAFTSCRLFG